MNSIVLDSAAILAMIQSEPGGDAVLDAIDEGVLSIAISSVNFCEVMTKLVRDGLSLEDTLLTIEPLREYVVAFDEGHAIRTAALQPLTSSFGLSLGDRACLALASDRQAVAWTSDRVWKQISVGVPVHLIRP